MKPVRPGDLTPAKPPEARMTRRSLLLGGTGIARRLFRRGGGDRSARYALQALATWLAGRSAAVDYRARGYTGGPNMGIERIRNVVNSANALRSDIILLLGDFVATHRFVTEHVPGPVWAAELARLSASLGVHSILGNHDWWFHQAEIRASLKAVKIPVMENQALLLGPQGARFWLAGLGDQLAYPQPGGGFRGIDNLPGTLSQVSTDDPVILMVHEPDIFTQVPDRVSLTLAGHTHGGQLRLPLVWPALVPSEYGAQFAYGHVREGGRDLIVSGGLGTSIVPLRLGVPPEILRIELG